MPQEPAPAPTPWWPFVTIASLLIVIVGLIIVFYMAYAHNVELSKENSDISTQVVQLSTDKDTLTAQVTDLSKQIGQLTCIGTWNGTSCDPYPAFITNKVASGTSPLSVSFSVRTKSSKYGIDFGDGSTTPLTQNANGAACTPKDDGFCLFTVQHVFKNSGDSDAHFDVKLTLGTTTAAATAVTVAPKK